MGSRQASSGGKSMNDKLGDFLLAAWFYGLILMCVLILLLYCGGGKQ
jgi:hypothetical protein